MSEKLVRMSFTVPAQFRDDLSYISSRMGVSKSAALSTLMAETLTDIRSLLEQFPDIRSDQQIDDPAVRRFRDSSVTYINETAERVSRLLKGQ